jgi:hypothetical protein
LVFPWRRVNTDLLIAWNIHDGDFEAYDNIWKDHDPRSSRAAFINHSTGPYTEIDETNRAYKDYIRDLIDQDFDGIDGEEAAKVGYKKPRVEILGCYLPEGRMIPMCGRTPREFESRPGYEVAFNFRNEVVR